MKEEKEMSNNQFFYPDTPNLQYYQFPVFLLRAPVSQTAKILYMVIYDRARMSQRNRWTDDAGRVYAIYTVEDLADEIGRSVTQVKRGLNRLVEADLLEKESFQPGQPNRLYVRIPSDFRPAKYRRSKGPNSDRDAGGKPTPKQMNRTITQNQDHSSSTRTSSAGSFSNGMERPPVPEDELMRWLAGRNGNLV